MERFYKLVQCYAVGRERTLCPPVQYPATMKGIVRNGKKAALSDCSLPKGEPSIYSVVVHASPHFSWYFSVVLLELQPAPFFRPRHALIAFYSKAYYTHPAASATEGPR